MGVAHRSVAPFPIFGKVNVVNVPLRNEYPTTPSHGVIHESAIPPLRAQKLLHFWLPKSSRDSLIGDLDEEFSTKIVPKFGIDSARWWYWKQTVFELAAAVMPKVKMLIAFAWFTKAAAWLYHRLGM